jgi:hypothetical protein
MNQSKTEDFLRFWASWCARFRIQSSRDPDRSIIFRQCGRLNWPNDSPERCPWPDAGDREIERLGQLPTDPITLTLHHRFLPTTSLEHL